MTRVQFENYKKFKNVNIKLNDKATIFIGQNDSGKSSLLNGIYEAISQKDGSSASPNFYSKVVNKDVVITIFFKVETEDIDKALDQLSLPRLQKDDLLNHHEFRLECTYKFHEKIINKYLKLDEITNNYDDDFRLGCITRQLLKILKETINIIKSKIPQFDERSVSTDKLLRGNNRTNYPLNYLLYLQKERPDVFYKFNEIVGSLFNEPREIELKEHRDRIKLFVSQTHKGSKFELDVNEMGSGFNKSLSIVMSIFVSDPKIVIIDEPDLSMHPKLIKELVKYIRELGKQIILSSHNEIIINEFEKEQIKYVEYLSPFYSMVNSHWDTNESRALEALGIDVRIRKSALLYKDLILLVEGPSDDEDYIHLLLHISGHNNIKDRYRLSFISTDGKKIVDIREFDRVNKDKLRILYVRDRDETSPEFIRKWKNKLGNRIHFWKRREIENYFLTFNSIYKTICCQLAKSGNCSSITLQQLKCKIKELANEKLKKKTAILSIYDKYKLIPLSTDRNSISKFIVEHANVQAEELVVLFYDKFFKKLFLEKSEKAITGELLSEIQRLGQLWENEEEILNSCPGKDLIHEIELWLKEEYHLNINLNPKVLCSHLDASEVDPDFGEFVQKIIENCDDAKQRHKRSFKFNKNNFAGLKLKYTDVYFNKYYNHQHASPALNFNTVYIDGTLKNDLDTNKTHEITIYDFQTKNTRIIPIHNDTKLNHITFDPLSGLLFSTAQVTRPNEGYLESRVGEVVFDAILIINPNGKITTIEFNAGDEIHDAEGKEGALTDLFVNAIDENNATIYAASVYPEGGFPGLRIVKCVINKKSSKVTNIKKMKLKLGYDGPIASCVDTANKKIFLLDNDKDDYANAVIFIVDMQSNTIVDKITLEECDFTISPEHRSIMTNYTDNKLLLVIKGKMIVIDLIDKTTRTLNDYEQIEYIAYSPNTGNIYAILKEDEDEKSASKDHYCLYCITPNLLKQRILTFQPQLEITDVRYAEGTICVHAGNLREKVHSLWIVNETEAENRHSASMLL
ncbi:MAG TPA: AAA family ATPase [Nitrososphaeraceae archaeon]|nr:AAA family ATPase [Nitrososphaeraceae archaeon]